MGKVVDGVELLRMIRDGEIKNETLIEDTENNNKYKYNAEIESFYLINEEEYEMMHYYTDKEFASSKFEILSEEIDIQAIEIVKNITSNGKDGVDFNTSRIMAETINQLVKAVKQLNKKLEEK